MNWNTINSIVGMSKKDKRRKRRKREETPRQQRMRAREANQRKNHTRQRRGGRFMGMVAIMMLTVVLLPSCKVSSGAYGARDGIVLCQATMIEAEGKAPYPVATGGNTIRQGSCDGEAFTSVQLSLKVRLHRVDAIINGFVFSTVCGQSETVVLANTSGFHLTASNQSCFIAPGHVMFAESEAEGYIGNWGPYESTQRSPHEELTLP